GGRLVGYLTAAAWVAVPFCAIPLWDHSYHVKYVEQFLPQAFGLTGLGDFPSMVCLLVAALFCFRVLDTRDPLDGVLAGIAAVIATFIWTGRSFERTTSPCASSSGARLYGKRSRSSASSPRRGARGRRRFCWAAGSGPSCSSRGAPTSQRSTAAPSCGCSCRGSRRC